MFSDKFAQRSSDIKSLKEELILLGFNESCPNTDPITPAMKIILDGINDRLKATSLTTNYLPLIIDGKSGGSPVLSPFE